MRAYLLAVGLLVLLCASVHGQGWSRFRGPDGQGIAEARLPKTFTEENVRWRVPAGVGHSSPVLWGDRLYLTRVGEGESPTRALVCFDATTGGERWAKSWPFESHGQHRLNSFASSTPAVDAAGVYLVWSSGEELRVRSVDHDGEERWDRTVGAFAAQHGSGASPVVIADRLVVANDHETEGSFLLGLDPATGETHWKIERTTVRASYATPAVIRDEGGTPTLVFASTAHGATAVDPISGEVVWETGPGFEQRFVATPGFVGRHLFLTAGSGSGGKECVVLELPEPGQSGVPPIELYRPPRNLPYVPSVLGIDGRFYLFNDGGIVSCLEATSGDVLWRERIEGSFFSSPVSNREVVYIADREGVLYSFAPSDEFELLGEFALGATVFATPAIDRDSMYVRTATELIRLGAPEE